MPWQPELPFSDQKPLADNEVSRTIALGDRIVPYILRRSRRRSIGLQIDHRGLRVGAPYRATLTEVEALIYKHGDWVAQKLDEWREQRRPEWVAIHDGLRLPLLGRSLEIRLTSGNNRFEWHDTAEPMLTLRLRHADTAGEVLERALRERALVWFSARLKDFSDRLGLTPPPLALTSARTRWGSCSRRSGIRLNWRLIHFPPHVVDYVVAHELAHLREMNHGPRFWRHVEEIFPDYLAARSALNELASRCPQWQK